MIKQDILQVFHQAGMRATPQRIAILESLTETQQHPTATDLFELLKPDYPSLSLATVYNTLDVLVGMGLLNAIGNLGDDRVHFDANLAPHINLACLNCHKIVDLSTALVGKLDAEISKNSGYDIQGSNILYFGYCPECKQSMIQIKGEIS